MLQTTSLRFARLALPLAALALAMTVTACGSGQDIAKTAPPIPVNAFTVGGVLDDRETATFAATAHFDRESTLSFRLGGTVRTAPPQNGKLLSAGALIAAITPSAYQAGADRQAAEVARLERAAARYAGLVNEGAVADAQARDAHDALTAARAGLAAARYDLRSTRLVMPFNGIVLTRQAELGETVAPGQPVVLVADLSTPLIATAQVSADFAARLRPGLSASVTSSGQAPLTARVLRVAGSGDPRSGTMAVDVVLPPGTRIASGTPLSVRIALPSAPTATATASVLIPAEALLAAQGPQATVYVIDGQGRARRRTVRFEGFVDRSARVSGLPAGTRVITAGAGFVVDGDRVAVSGA